MEIYRRIAAEGPCDLAQLISPGEREASAEAGIDELVRLGLLQVFGDSRLAVVDPAEVADRLVEPWEHRLEEGRLGLLHLQSRLAEIALVHGERQRSFIGPQLERIDQLEDVNRLLDKCSMECREEVLAAQPGGARPSAQLRDARDRDQELLERGVRLRSLYQHSARFDAATVRYAEEIGGLGAEVRTVTGHLPRFIIFDSKIMFMSQLIGRPGTALVVRNAELVGLAVQTFELMWPDAELIGRRRKKSFLRSITNQTKLSILRHLAAGKDDRATARALGISVRTCQRYVSEMMASLGATSRFQLGCLIQQEGLLDQAAQLEDDADAGTATPDSSVAGE